MIYRHESILFRNETPEQVERIKYQCKQTVMLSMAAFIDRDKTYTISCTDRTIRVGLPGGAFHHDAYIFEIEINEVEFNEVE